LLRPPTSKRNKLLATLLLSDALKRQQSLLWPHLYNYVAAVQHFVQLSPNALALALVKYGILGLRQQQQQHKG
jgi:hypothetical protein